MTSRQRVALVAAADSTRSALADYLASAGFDIHVCEQLDVSAAFDAIVVLAAASTSGDTLVTYVRSWIRRIKGRVVVVTAKPSALRDLVLTSERLYVLPAPVFGWDLVDALRAAEPQTPRGA